MNDEIVRSLVKNFSNNILTRLIFLIVIAISAIHFSISPDWMMAPLAIITGFNMIELHFVNRSFQSHFDNRPKFVMLVSILDYISLGLSIIYLLTIALLTVI